MPSPRVLRKKFLVNPGMQLSVAGAVLSAFLALAAVFVGANLLLGGQEDRIGDPSSQEAMRMGIVVTGAYFLLVLAAVIVVAVISTQKIAGPAMVIEAALRGTLSGDFDRRLELRRKDHLANLAEVASEVREMIRVGREEEQDFHGKMDEALRAGNLDLAIQLNQQHLTALPHTERKAA